MKTVLKMYKNHLKTITGHYKTVQIGNLIALRHFIYQYKKPNKSENIRSPGAEVAESRDKVASLISTVVLPN